VAARKAARPATDRPAREPRRVDRLGQRIDTDANPQQPELQAARMLSVFDGRVRVGFIVRRERVGFEAFTADDRSLGLFATERDAADAISAAGIAS
jgi:hypothetical protein